MPCPDHATYHRLCDGCNWARLTGPRGCSDCADAAERDGDMGTHCDGCSPAAHAAYAVHVAAAHATLDAADATLACGHVLHAMAGYTAAARAFASAGLDPWARLSGERFRRAMELL